ncbi:MAG: hypothetical protein GX036_04150 [Firmicutes bacterium]|jgi:hypothetical protein|nr:hypothetical protein [Bacillota bacterium]
MAYQQNQNQQNMAQTEVAKSPGRISQILATQDLIGLEIGTISGQQQQFNQQQQQFSQQQQGNQQQQSSGQQSELEQSQGQMSRILADQARQQ